MRPDGVARDAEEVGDERLRGEVVAVDVAAPPARSRRCRSRRPRRAAAHGPGRPGRGSTTRVGRQRHADRHRPVRVDDGPGRADGRLGRPVDVEEPPAGTVPAHDQVVRAGLARHQQEAQLGEVVLEGGQQRRHAAHRGDPALGEERRAGRRRAGCRPAGFGTSVAPTAHGTQISSKEKSNAIVRPWYTRSSGRTPYTSRGHPDEVARCSRARPPRPSGRPVEPEV